MFSLVISEVATHVLASYDLFLVSGQITTAYIQSEWTEEDKITTGGKSADFWWREFCVLTYVEWENWIVIIRGLTPTSVCII
jgi:hypothetical protein